MSALRPDRIRQALERYMPLTEPDDIAAQAIIRQAAEAFAYVLDEAAKRQATTAELQECADRELTP